MPKRNRSREIALHGQLLGRPEVPATPPAVVTDEDLQQFGALSLWSKRYVNHIYDHGDVNGGPLPKTISEPVWWRTRDADVLTVRAGQRTDLVFPSLSDRPALAEYFRQEHEGVRLVIEARTDELVTLTEKLTLTLDADGEVKGDEYYSFSSPPHSVPAFAPDADFRSIQDAHDRTVSGRAAHLLGRFHGLVIDPSAPVEMRGVWNRDFGFVAPPELQELPPYPTVQ